MKNSPRSKKSTSNPAKNFIVGLLSGIIISGLVVYFSFSKLMFSVSESKYNFEQTAEILTESVKENNWNLSYQYDLQQTMAKHGHEVKQVKVFSICKPDIAIRVLGTDNDRHISAMMPCRVAIYEKADGKTYIARMNAGLFSILLGGNATAVMGDAGSGSENILKSVIKE